MDDKKFDLSKIIKTVVVLAILGGCAWFVVSTSAIVQGFFGAPADVQGEQAIMEPLETMTLGPTPEPEPTATPTADLARIMEMQAQTEYNYSLVALNDSEANAARAQADAAATQASAAATQAVADEAAARLQEQKNRAAMLETNRRELEETINRARELQAADIEMQRASSNQWWIIWAMIAIIAVTIVIAIARIAMYRAYEHSLEAWKNAHSAPEPDEARPEPTSRMVVMSPDHSFGEFTDPPMTNEQISLLHMFYVRGGRSLAYNDALIGAGKFNREQLSRARDWFVNVARMAIETPAREVILLDHPAVVEFFRSSINSAAAS